MAGSTRFRRGDVLDHRYRLERVLGRGHFGVVFAATQLSLGREVAVKLLFANKSRLLQEAQTASRIAHPNVARIYDVSVDAETNQPYMVSELVQGETLTSLIRRQRSVDERRWVGLIHDAAQGLAAAHAMGILHNDIKPTNAIVSRLSCGRMILKLVDFGQASAAEGGAYPSSGTATFASPELSTGRPVDERSDVYALGCLLYAGIEGRAPFVATDVAEVIELHLRATPPTLHACVELRVLYRSMLEKRPTDRPSSALEVANRLGEVARLLQWRERRAVNS